VEQRRLKVWPVLVDPTLMAEILINEQIDSNGASVHPGGEFPNAGDAVWSWM
jgi:hypothetical protein